MNRNNLGDQLHVLITNWPIVLSAGGQHWHAIFMWHSTAQQWNQLSTLQMKELIDTAGELNVAVEEEWHTSVICYIACQTASAYRLTNTSKTHHKYVGWWGYLLVKEELLQAAEGSREPERVCVRQLPGSFLTEIPQISSDRWQKASSVRKAWFIKCYKSCKVGTASWPSCRRKLWLLSWH